MKQKTLDLMNACNFCVVSTVNVKGLPELALMGFSENSDLELMFGTSSKTRKYKNIMKNPHVSVVISDTDRRLTVQYEGAADLIQPEDLDRRLNEHFKKLPFARKYTGEKDQVWLRVVPKWVRYSDSSEHPTKVDEVRY